MAASRSRRGPSKRQLARDAEFDSLRKVLSSDVLRSEQYKLEDEGDVYEVVDETRYHEIVKERRAGAVCFHILSELAFIDVALETYLVKAFTRLKHFPFCFSFLGICGG